MELVEKNIFFLTLNLKYSAFKHLQLWIKKVYHQPKNLYNFLSYLILYIMLGSFSSWFQLINMGNSIK